MRTFKDNSITSAVVRVSLSSDATIYYYYYFKQHCETSGIYIQTDAFLPVGLAALSGSVAVLGVQVLQVALAALGFLWRQNHCGRKRQVINSADTGISHSEENNSLFRCQK